MTRGVPRGFDPSYLVDALRLRQKTVADLSKMSDVSPGMIFKYLRGEHKPQIDSIVKMCRALDVEIPFLLRISAGTEELSDLRNLKGWTRSEAAELVGLTPAVYASVEIGVRRLSEGELAAFAQVYDVSVEAVEAAWTRVRNSPYQDQ